jgi:hypothetical protein
VFIAVNRCQEESAVADLAPARPRGVGFEAQAVRRQSAHEKALTVARYQPPASARYAAVDGAAREADAFRVKRPRP